MPVRRSESGFSLVETLIGILIGSLAMIFISKAMDNISRQSKRIENRTDQSQVVFWLRSNIGCSNLPQTCNLADQIAIPDTTGGVLIANDGSTVSGRWTVRALCSNASTGDFVIQVASLDSQGNVILDPLDKTPLDFNHQKAQVAQRTDLCSDAMVVQASSSTYQLTSPTECVNTDSSVECVPSAPVDCPPGTTSVTVISDQYGHLNGPWTTGTAHFRLCQ